MLALLLTPLLLLPVLAAGRAPVHQPFSCHALPPHAAYYCTLPPLPPHGRARVAALLGVAPSHVWFASPSLASEDDAEGPAAPHGGSGELGGDERDPLGDGDGGGELAVVYVDRGANRLVSLSPLSGDVTHSVALGTTADLYALVSDPRSFAVHGQRVTENGLVSMVRLDRASGETSVLLSLGRVASTSDLRAFSPARQLYIAVVDSTVLLAVNVDTRVRVSRVSVPVLDRAILLHYDDRADALLAVVADPSSAEQHVWYAIDIGTGHATHYGPVVLGQNSLAASTLPDGDEDATVIEEDDEDDPLMQAWMADMDPSMFDDVDSLLGTMRPDKRRIERKRARPIPVLHPRHSPPPPRVPDVGPGERTPPITELDFQLCVVHRMRAILEHGAPDDAANGSPAGADADSESTVAASAQLGAAIFRRQEALDARGRTAGEPRGEPALNQAYLDALVRELDGRTQTGGDDAAGAHGDDASSAATMLNPDDGEDGDGARQMVVPRRLANTDIWASGNAGVRRRLLVEAVRSGDTDTVRMMVEHGMSVESVDAAGFPLLMIAARNNHAAIVRLLIEHGADVHRERASDGSTALMQATFAPSVEAMGMLLAHGADPNSGDRNSLWTVLHSVVPTQNQRAIEMLLRAGADVNVRSTKGLSPLLIAAAQGNPSIVRLLLRYGAKVDLSSFCAELHVASSYGGRTLVVHSSDYAPQRPAPNRVSVLDCMLGSPLSAAVFMNHVPVVRVLLEAGADARPVAERFRHDAERAPLIALLDEHVAHSGASYSSPARPGALSAVLVNGDASDPFGLVPTMGQVMTAGELVLGLLLLLH